MESKANYALVGLFATLVVAALLGFIYWFVSAQGGGARTPYTVVFEGSVTGLSAGTNVLFNGVPVGSVSNVGIDPNDPTQVLARIQVDADAPVKTDTTAILEVQGLTGGAYIQLLGGSPDAPALTPAPGQSVAVLRGQASDLQNILDGAGDIMASAESALSRLDSMLGDNEANISATLSNLESLTAALAAFTGETGEGAGIDGAVADLQQTIERASATFTRIDQLIAGSADSFTATLANAETFSATLAGNSENIDRLIVSLADTSDRIGPLAGEVQALSSDLGAIVAAVSPERVAASLEGLEETIAAASSTFAAIEGAIGPDGASLAATLANAETFSATLAGNSENIDRLIVSLADTSDRIGPLAEEVQTLSSDLGAIVAAVSPERVAASLEGLEQTIATANSTFAAIEGAVGPNAAALAATIENAETFSAVLAANASGVDTFLSSLAETSDQIGPLAEDVRLLATDVRALVEAVPPERVADTVDSVATFADALSRNTPNIEAFFVDAGTLAANLAGVSEGLQSTLDLIDEASEAIDAQAIGRAMDNIDAFSLALGRNAGNVDQILVNTRNLTDTLASASEQIDAIIARVDGLVATEGGESLFADISAASLSIRMLADNLDNRTAEITDAITRFTNVGTDDYSALAVDARTTLQQLQRVLSEIERNPQVLVFGGDTMREFQR